MTIARKHLVHRDRSAFYHVYNRCIRRAFLLSRKSRRKRDLRDRRRWIERTILDLARFFAVEVYAYAVMGNHYHIVLYHDPTACADWPPERVAERWIDLRFGSSAAAVERRDARIRAVCADSVQIERARECLGSLSGFMKVMNERIALRINREDNQRGHLWAGRFQSNELLDMEAVRSCCAYVDSNPARAMPGLPVERQRHVSLRARLATPRAADGHLRPIAGGTCTDAPALPWTLGEHLALCMQSSRKDNAEQGGEQSLEVRRILSIEFRGRVIGLRDSIRRYLQQAGLSRIRGRPLPDS